MRTFLIENEKKIKPTIIFSLLVLSCVITYHFHLNLKKGMIFTHFFYIPIILSSLWWQGKGLRTALFLGAVLMLSHTILGLKHSFVPDILRITIFLSVAFITDIIVKRMKLAEENFLTSSIKYKSLYQSINEGVSIYRFEETTGDFFLENINRSGCRIHGFDKKEVIGSKISEIFPDLRETDLPAIFRKVWETGASTCVPTKLYTGSVLFGWRSFFVYKLPAGEIICITKDQDKRQERERENRLFAAAIDQAAECIIIGGKNGMIRYVNPAFESITGYCRDEVLGKHFGILQPVKENQKQYDQIRKIVLKGEIFRGRLVNCKKDGTPFDADTTVSPVINKDGAVDYIVAIIRDITDELKLRNQTRQSQKMEAIGTLVGGIAHDFNNILSPIMGYAQLSQLQLKENPKLVKNLDAIIMAANRARDLVSQILMFSKSREQEKQSVKIGLIVIETLRLIKSVLPSTITVEKIINTKKDYVIADPTQIHQVLMNLCTNAYHAMRDKGGLLTVTLSKSEADDEHLKTLMKKQDIDFLKIEVSDTGHGIDKQIIEKIFEPYFTTKEANEGTGLGLSVTHKIIHNHEGHIFVESTPELGTCFSVYLPLLDTNSQKIEALPEEIIKKGSETIMIVDDELSIIEMEEQMLEEFGYKVSGWTDVGEAYDYFEKNSGEIDLVVTDMTMPGQTGLDFSRKIMAKRPELPIILLTGIIDSKVMLFADSLGIKATLGKPICNKELIGTIRRLLD